MGPENFAAFRRDYYETYHWGIASGDDFKALAEQHCPCELTALFDEWVSKPSS
jgi:aminopeptidase N